MAQVLSSIRAIQALGITSAAMLSGAVFSISYISTPPLLLAPSPLVAHQWQATYDRGKATAPPLALMSSLSFAYLAYKFYNVSVTLNRPVGELYALASIATLSIVPFTLLVMSNVNGKLNAAAEESKGLKITEQLSEVKDARGESTKELVDWWATLNFVRGVFPLAGAVLGLSATLA